MKTVEIAGVGEVQLHKHARSKSIRINITADQKVRVTLPTWVPYHAAIAFAHSKRQWIIDNVKPQELIAHAIPVGKFHHLYFRAVDGNTTVSARRKGSELWVSYPPNLLQNSPEVQKAANSIAVKALREQAENLLPKRLRDLAEKNNFTFTSVSVRQLKARWGSCNSKKEITLNLFLMQLPWDLIDYVLIHELAHTKALHHGPDFWEIFEKALPGARKKRSLLRAYKPKFGN